MTLGEIGGFAVPAVTGALVVTVAAPVQVAALLAAGVAEGAVLGYAQSRVLRQALPQLPANGWIVATGLGAGVAWGAGLTPAYAWPLLERLPWQLLAAGGLLLGTVLLLSIGLAQAYLLRRLVVGAGWWVAATALAWLVGLLMFALITTPLWQPGQTWPVVALIGVAAGAVMAATMAAVTGLALVRLTAAGRLRS